MKSSSLISSLFVLLQVLHGQDVQRPTVIGAEVNKTGRFAHFDMNRDGWDDLWLHLFPKIDTSHPGLDDDHDGKSNYKEILDFQDPYRINRPTRELSAAEIVDARKASVEARRASDSQKRQRFQALLESRGAMNKGNETKKASPGLDEKKTDKALPAGSSLMNDPVWNSLMLCSVRAPFAPTIIGMERLSNGQILLAW